MIALIRAVKLDEAEVADRDLLERFPEAPDRWGRETIPGISAIVRRRLLPKPRGRSLDGEMVSRPRRNSEEHLSHGALNSFEGTLLSDAL